MLATPSLRRSATRRRNLRSTRRPERLEERCVMDGAYHSLAGGNLTQNWSSSGLITTNNDWSAVPSIEGYNGDGLTASNDVDARTVLATGGILNVLANQSSTSITNGGLAEFDGIADRVVAMQGSGTADAPYLIFYVNATGASSVRIRFNARDVDGTADNAPQQLSVQYRIGTSGSFTDLPTAYIADATTGPSIATLVSPVDVTLPAAADNQSQVQIRVLTTNATGNDEWIGVDDIIISGTLPNQPPVNTAPASVSGLEDVPISLNGANLISIADPDAGGAAVRTTLTVTNGTLTATGAGATVTGSGSNSIIIDGTVSTINATLLSLAYLPNINFSGSDSLQVLTTDLGNTGSGGAQIDTDNVSITVNPVADTASVTNAITNEDTQTTSGLVVSRNAVDGAEVTHFRITSITNGTLFLNDGTTQITNGSFVTFAQASAGLKFTPNANFFGTGSFQVQASTSNVVAGLGGGLATATITVNPIADTPSVTNSTTNEDTQTTSGLVISRNAVDATEVTHFKITGIANGTLYQNDGFTSIANGSFITVAQGNAGLKFTPNLNFFGTGSFQAQASLSNADAGLGGGVVTATITVNPVADTPSVTNATTTEDVQTTSGLVISRNPADGNEVTHFKITGIANGTLFLNNGTTQVTNGSFVTFAQANAGLKFTPNANFFGTGSFQVQASTSNTDPGLGGGLATATITVGATPEVPSVTNATTNEDTQTTSGLVIAVNPVDGPEVTFFKISNITNGTLYLSNGTTEILSGDFITVAQGNAGLKFTPAQDLNNVSTTFGFDVQASIFPDDTALGGSAHATITVNAVNDAPSATTNGLVITLPEDFGPYFDANFFTFSPGGGPDEASQQIAFITTNNFVNAGLFGNFGPIAFDGSISFEPPANAFGTASMDFTVTDDGTLSASTVPQTLTLIVTPVADTPSVTNATTNEDVQTTTGLVISRNASDGAEVTHFQITGINNGSLFLNNGTTPVTNGQFITFAQANAGLKFTPAANFNGAGSFGVQASTSASATGLGGGVVTATITVDPVNDEPTFNLPVTTVAVLEDAGAQTNPGFAAAITAGGGETGQTLTFSVTPAGAPTGNLAFTTAPSIDPITGNLTFTAAANTNGSQTFNVVLTDDGSNASPNDNTSITRTFTINVAAVNDRPTVTIGGNQTINEDAGAQSVASFATNFQPGGGSDEAPQTLLGYTVTVTGTTGGLTFSSPPAIGQSGALTYAVAPNSNGTATISVVANDSGPTAGGLNQSLPQSFTITVNAVNDEPTFTLPNLSTTSLENQGTIAVASFAANISAGPANESSQILDFQVAVQGTPTGNLAFSTPPSINPTTGALTYAAVANTSGTATVTVYLHDNGGTGFGGDDTSATQTFTITVLAVKDFGDAPDSYGTLLASNGARHAVGPNTPYLGAGVDTEPEGAPSLGAIGDDFANSDDEDGVGFLSPVTAGLTTTIVVTASAPTFLDAWLDFDRNGTFDPSDQIFTSQQLAAGANTLSFAVPVGASIGLTYARFRVSSTGGLAPTGLALDGEVEDFSGPIGKAAPGAYVNPLPNGSGNELVVFGTDTNDTINISKVGANASIKINKLTPQNIPLTGLTGIRVHALGGNDTVKADTGAKFVGLPLTIYGDQGNDTLSGGLLGDILVGGDGNDKLLGLDGRDILIGGLGKDAIDGGKGEDLLIGGKTDYDANLDYLASARKLWIDTAFTYNTRAAWLRLGTFSPDGLTSYSPPLGVANFTDTEVDSFFGGDDFDYYLLSTGDKFNKRGATEQTQVANH